MVSHVEFKIARPRACICLWMLCLGRLATKGRLKRFGLIQETNCSLCHSVEEACNHFFFACLVAHDIWYKVLHWLDIIHDPQN